MCWALASYFPCDILKGGSLPTFSVGLVADIMVPWGPLCNIKLHLKFFQPWLCRACHRGHSKATFSVGTVQAGQHPGGLYLEKDMVGLIRRGAWRETGTGSLACAEKRTRELEARWQKKT